MPESVKALVAFPSQELMKPFVPMILAALSAASTAHGITYEAWQAQVFTVGEAANPLVGGDLADPDQDGFNNLLEYALKGDPKTANTALMPTASKAANEAGALHYTRRREALDLDYIVEVSNDLVTWHSGFANVWTTDAVPNAYETANGVALVITDHVTATSQLAASGKQFMRLKVIRSPRAGIKAAITADGNNPTTLTLNSVVPSGPYAGAITQHPIFTPHETRYLLNWYFAARGLESFVETHPDMCKALILAYLRNLDVENGQTTFRIHDIYVLSDKVNQGAPDWSFDFWCHSDSDDSYAAGVLLLAGKLKRLYPNDDWLASATLTPDITVLQRLKDIAYVNFFIQAKNEQVVEHLGGPIIANRSIKVFQNGHSNISDPRCVPEGDPLQVTNYPVGFLMDNVHVWAALNEFTTALEIIEGTSSDVAYFKGWRDQQLANIHSVFWDTAQQAWRIDDQTQPGTNILFPAQTDPFYAALHCQLYPELYGMPYPGNSIETQRRYNMAWKWVIDHMPNWTESEAWPSGVNDDKFSHLEIAVVAAMHGEKQMVEDFLNMARGRWLPGGTFPNGTVSEQIGYWQLLVGH